jgi:hypothetical protein
MPALAVEAILRSQIELAMNGNVRAQRDILNAVRAYERADAEEAAAYVEELARRGADLEEAVRAAERAMPTAEKKINYIEAARQIKELLGLNKPRSAAGSEVAESEICAPGEETDTEESDAERTAAAPALSAAGAPQPENDAAPAAPPVAPPPPSADPPAAPQTWRSLPPRPDRSARQRAREATPSPGADLRAGRLHNRLLRNRCLVTGQQIQHHPST